MSKVRHAMACRYIKRMQEMQRVRCGERKELKD